ncbi:MAG: hypothetical protein HC764_01165 [Pleurocapsa sp. CRU_1_2]|nr:hypothetical protein [Pleurocapsa sp. CRU_1_2]
MKCDLGGFHHEQLHQEAMKCDLGGFHHKQLHQEAMSQVQSLPESGISLIIINF